MQRLLIRQCLESEGMRVLEAQDGHEALDLAANNNPESGIDLVDQVVGLFEQQTPTFINEIKMATREADAAETRRVAHAYKSSANNIGAVVLARRLAEIEASARDEQRVLTTEEVSELDGLVRESLRQLLAAYVRLRSEFASDEDQ